MYEIKNKQREADRWYFPTSDFIDDMKIGSVKWTNIQMAHTAVVAHKKRR